MPDSKFSASVFKDPSWWHWAATIPLLGLHLAGYPEALVAAVVLCCIMAGYFELRVRAIKPFPVQIRIAYAVLLLAGALPLMQWIHWVQLVGTTAMITVGYCPLLRLLKLLPWNRTQPLTPAYLHQTFIRDPMAGGLVQFNSSPQTSADCCSLQQPSMSCKTQDTHLA